MLAYASKVCARTQGFGQTFSFNNRGLGYGAPEVRAHPSPADRYAKGPVPLGGTGRTLDDRPGDKVLQMEFVACLNNSFQRGLYFFQMI